MDMPKLFAVVLGGRARGCNVELHDVQFAVGETIEETYPDLLRLWFGAPDGLHLDSYMPLEVVDGFRVTVSPLDVEGDQKLFFVNLGAYRAGVFGEDHANTFIVAASPAIARQRAKAELMQGWGSPVHHDNLLDIDDCLEVCAKGWSILLEPTAEPPTARPVNGYHPIPKSVVAAFKRNPPIRPARTRVKGER